MTTLNVRAAAAQVVYGVLDKGLSLTAILPEYQSKVGEKDASLLQELCFGVIRHYAWLDNVTRQLLETKFNKKQRVFHHLINVGIYQLEYMRIPNHAAVSETVQACVVLKGTRLKGLVNACLRNYQRKLPFFKSAQLTESVEYNHPGWFIDKVKTHYPENYKQILMENQSRAPMWIRVQEKNCSIDHFYQLLKERDIGFTHPLHKQGILLNKPTSVHKLPGFELGWFAVQDGAAQHAALLLEPKDGEIILDACTAPGGKACHILDIAECDLFAADIDSERLRRVNENLSRLNVNATVVNIDLTDEVSVDNLPMFDKILLDAPCSATGVIRRHPDIKWLRRKEDIDQLVKLQQSILDLLWQKLKSGGTLLYATCSILPEENSMQMKQFLNNNQDASLVKICESETNESPGWQILPGTHNMDGFYYCKIVKTLSNNGNA